MMNVLDLTPQQLRRAAAIKEKLDALSRELRNRLGWSGIGKEAQHERSGKEENCRCAEGAMGGAEAS